MRRAGSAKCVEEVAKAATSLSYSLQSGKEKIQWRESIAATKCVGAQPCCAAACPVVRKFSIRFFSALQSTCFTMSTTNGTSNLYLHTMTFDPIHFGLVLLFLFFVVGPAGAAYYLRRLTRDAPPRWKLILRIGSVVLICVAVAVLLLILFIAFMYGLHPA